VTIASVGPFEVEVSPYLKTKIGKKIGKNGGFRPFNGKKWEK